MLQAYFSVESVSLPALNIKDNVSVYSELYIQQSKYVVLKCDFTEVAQ